ncbi:MAG: HAD-IA family hydrolase [Cellvibrionales bacterium]|nr:HAD-IA family hydrolase [Cellvibrionales bacterium]
MLLIFDWDGTLIDSAAKIVTCMQYAAEESGVEPLPDEPIRHIIGLSLPQAIAVLYPNESSALHEDIRQRYVSHYIGMDQTPTPLFAGVTETLHTLRDAGYTLAVATGKARRGLDRVLEQMGMQKFFHATRCADETRSKPHPQMLHELLDFFVCAPEQALMVGDSSYDMEMAQAAGVPRVAVSYGAHSVEQMLRYEPVACLDQFADLLPVVTSIVDLGVQPIVSKG